jgi:hypothetical protein
MHIPLAPDDAPPQGRARGRQRVNRGTAMKRGPQRPEVTRVTRSLRPGQAGTLKLGRRYGDALICVRYREDALGATRYTTVELVVDEAPVQRRLSGRTIVHVRIEVGELTLRTQAKAMGAKWDARGQLWRMSLRAARALGLTSRIRPEVSIDRQPN